MLAAADADHLDADIVLVGGSLAAATTHDHAAGLDVDLARRLRSTGSRAGMHLRLRRAPGGGGGMWGGIGGSGGLGMPGTRGTRVAVRVFSSSTMLRPSIGS